MIKMSGYAAILLTSLMVQAADTDVFTLGRVEIVAEQLPVSTSMEVVIDSESVKKHNLKNIAETAQLVPGVTMDQTGDRNEYSIMVRGFDSRQVPVFIDGIPVYIPYEGNVDLGRFTSADIGELRVAKGFSSVLYGSNTLGGAVNIVSKRPVKELEGNVGIEFLQGESSGTSGYEPSFNLGSNQESWYLQLGASYINRDAFSISDDFPSHKNQDGKTRENSSQEDRKISFKVGLTPNDTDEYVIGFADQHGEKGTPPYAGVSDSVKTRYWQWPYWDKQSLYFLSNTVIGKGYIKSRVYYDTFENALYSYDDDTFATQLKRRAFRSLYDDYTYGASVEGGYPVTDKNMLRMSLTWKDDVHQENDEGEPKSKYEDRTLSVALEDTYEMSDKTSVVAGVSYDQREAVEAKSYNDPDYENLPTDTTHAWNPQIGIFHSLENSNKIRATISRKTRFATIKDRYSYHFGSTIPNPELNPERATHYEIGYSTIINDIFRFDAAIFQSDVDDLMQFVAIGDVDNDGEDEDQKKNIGEVRNRGFELSLSAYMSDTLEFGGSYSYLDRENISDPDILLIATPEHKLFAYADWDFAPQWELVASARYESERISTSDGELRTDSFTLVNAKVGYEAKKDLNIELGARNLFDEDYAYDEGYPQAGRTWFTSVRYSF